MKSTQLDNALSEFGNAAVDEVKRQADTQIQSAANALQSKVIDKIDTKVLRNAATQTLGDFASADGILNAKSVDDVVDNFGNKLADEVKGEVKQQVDKAIQSVANTVQQKFIEKIDDTTLRNASTQVLGKLSSFNGIMGAFNSIKGNSGLLKKNLGDMGRDIEKFISGQMDRADLMQSMADKAENYISDTVGKIATGLASEFGPLAPVIGELAANIAGEMFRNVVAPFLNAAKKAKMAREKYFALHELYEEAIAQMESRRQNFIEKMTEIFGQQEQLIEKSLDELEKALGVNNPEKVTAALNDIASGIGGQELPVKSFDDFKNKIKNREKLSMK